MSSRIKTLFFLIAVSIALWLAFGAKYAFAGDTTITWTLPTGSEVCTNDPAVPDIQATNIWQLVATGGPTDTSVTLTGLLPGEYTYVGSVVDTQGRVSRFSGTTTKTVGPLVTQTDRAFTVVKSTSGFTAFVVGTVPIGTECDENNMFKGSYNFQPFTGYAVPVASVTVTGDIELTAAFAECS